jgi:MFS family permease
VFVVAFFSNFILNFLTSLPVLVLVGILYGITHGILYPVLNAITVAIVPEKDRGASNALFTAVFNGGMMVFALSLGFLVDARGSYLAAFNVSAFACLAGAAVVALFSLRYGGVEVSADESTAIIPKE